MVAATVALLQRLQLERLADVPASAAGNKAAAAAAAARTAVLVGLPWAMTPRARFVSPGSLEAAVCILNAICTPTLLLAALFAALFHAPSTTALAAGRPKEDCILPRPCSVGCLFAANGAAGGRSTAGLSGLHVCTAAANDSAPSSSVCSYWLPKTATLQRRERSARRSNHHEPAARATSCIRLSPPFSMASPTLSVRSPSCAGGWLADGCRRCSRAPRPWSALPSSPPQAIARSRETLKTSTQKSVRDRLVYIAVRAPVATAANAALSPSSTLITGRLVT